MRYRAGPDLFDNGWQTVIPARGKACGKGWARWRTETPPRHLIEAWASVRPDDNVALIMNGSVIAIDLDHDDAQRAFAIRELADEQLGETELWRTRAPGYRSMRVYRPEHSGIATHHFPGVDLSIYCDTGLIILGGQHPTSGTEYTWPDASPLDCAPDDLPAISQDQIDAFITVVTAAFPPPEGVTPHGAGFRASTPHGVGADDVFAHFEATRGNGATLTSAASDFIARSSQMHPAMAAAVWCLAGYGYHPDKIADVLAQAVTTHPRAVATSPANRRRELERSAKGAVARLGG